MLHVADHVAVVAEALAARLALERLVQRGHLRLRTLVLGAVTSSALRLLHCFFFEIIKVHVIVLYVTHEQVQLIEAFLAVGAEKGPVLVQLQEDVLQDPGREEGQCPPLLLRPHQAAGQEGGRVAGLGVAAPLQWAAQHLDRCTATPTSWARCEAVRGEHLALHLAPRHGHPLAGVHLPHGQPAPRHQARQTRGLAPHQVHLHVPAAGLVQVPQLRAVAVQLRPRRVYPGHEAGAGAADD